MQFSFLRNHWIAVILLMLLFGALIINIYIFHYPVTGSSDNKEHLYNQARLELPGKCRKDVITLLGHPDREYSFDNGRKQRLAYFLRSESESNPYSGIDSIWIYVEIDKKKDSVLTVTIGSD